MNELLHRHALQITSSSIAAVLPDEAVRRALARHSFSPGKIVLVAVGKAAWQMANAAWNALGTRISSGVVVTKYGHIKAPIGTLQCFEAGHPVPDANSFLGTRAVLNAVAGLTAQDSVLFLLSGGGSALFELPLISPEELQSITVQLLSCGADIVEMNTLRKRLSAVKGGRFAVACAPAKIFSIVLSDIVGDPLDMIASGPACPDRSTAIQAHAVVDKYTLRLSSQALALLDKDTPKALEGVETQITGSVRELCIAAENACSTLGYEPILLTDQLCCEARQAGSFLASILRTHVRNRKPIAFLAGGETLVSLSGNGLGGRNQELALSAAIGISGLNAAIFSVGSDGTDGPTDAAGGYVDGESYAALLATDCNVFQMLANNDAYHALKKIGGLIFTGPTGTNVNDVAVALFQP